MNKIGVCACYNTKNYGSMLQTLATGQTLTRLGYDYEFIHYTRKPTPELVLKSLDRIPEILSAKLHNQIKKNKLKHYPVIIKGIRIRENCFDTFMNQNFTKMSPRYDTFAQLTEAAQQYSLVLVGSDQLWRPEGYSTGFYNLMFVPDDIPKIAYAASFGVSQIPERKKKIAKKFLNRIDHISVRELRASEMIKELIGRDVPTVVDPTLLFTGEEWKDIVPVRRIIEDKYIFCYLLGNNPQHRKWTEYLKQQTGHKIVTIPHLDEFVESDVAFGDYQLYDVGPSEFVNLIRNAEYVCTDSFHGTVFSILNHKQFVTFNRFADRSRNSRNSRIESLLSQVGLEKRWMTNEEHSIADLVFAETDYEYVDTKLYQMRHRSIEYLRSSLECV